MGGVSLLATAFVIVRLVGTNGRYCAFDLGCMSVMLYVIASIDLLCTVIDPEYNELVIKKEHGQLTVRQRGQGRPTMCGIGDQMKGDRWCEVGALTVNSRLIGGYRASE